MKLLQSFSGASDYFHRHADDLLQDHTQKPSIPYDKLPCDNNSGLYFNYIFDFKTGEMVFLNERFLELTGYERTFFKRGLGSWQEIIYPKDWTSVLKSVSVHTEAMLKIEKDQINKYSDNSTFRITTRFGKLITLLRQRLCLILDKAGNFQYEAGMFIDITPFRSDGNVRLAIHAPDGTLYLEYYPKEDAVPLISPIRKTVNNLESLSLQSNSKFLHHVLKILSARHHDAEFQVTDFSKQLNLSRSQFYRQLEKHAGVSPNRLLKIYRLQKSLEHLAQQEMSIAEVAWKVGFNNPGWFSKCFFEEFDCKPSDYRNLMD
ncbi:MAG TPA: helix-turn-helix domain-containing protein [Cyclobacteriaceae bacterium]|nr:helix-turn-helix domain-containing protein [Cyclobacteriaceae bacterium]